MGASLEERQTQRLAARELEAMVTEIDLGSGWERKGPHKMAAACARGQEADLELPTSPVVASAGQS